MTRTLVTQSLNKHVNFFLVYPTTCDNIDNDQPRRRLHLFADVLAVIDFPCTAHIHSTHACKLNARCRHVKTIKSNFRTTFSQHHKRNEVWVRVCVCAPMSIPMFAPFYCGKKREHEYHTTKPIQQAIVHSHSHCRPFTLVECWMNFRGFESFESIENTVSITQPNTICLQDAETTDKTEHTHSRREKERICYLFTLYITQWFTLSYKWIQWFTHDVRRQLTDVSENERTNTTEQRTGERVCACVGKWKLLDFRSHRMNMLCHFQTTSIWKKMWQSNTLQDSSTTRTLVPPFDRLCYTLHSKKFTLCEGYLHVTRRWRCSANKIVLELTTSYLFHSSHSMLSVLTQQHFQCAISVGHIGVFVSLQGFVFYHSIRWICTSKYGVIFSFGLLVQCTHNT